MFRVVYTWQVEPEDFEAFRDEWRITTNRIHETIKGARGSFMIRSVDNPSEVVTIAKWDSLEEWQTFWGNSNPEQMQTMKSLGKRVSVEAFEEIEDYTK